MKEYLNVRQERGSHRRLFSSDRFDLYVWYASPQGELTGFQIVYFQGIEQKAFTWTADGGYTHMTVDGWDSSYYNGTPLLVADGLPDEQVLLQDFMSELPDVDPEVAAIVHAKLDYYFGRSAPDAPVS